MKKRSIFITGYTLLINAVVFINLSFFGCHPSVNNTYELTGNLIKDGERLVNKYCSNCHSLVPVDALTREVWKYHALPSMAPYLGLASYMDSYYKSSKNSNGISLAQWLSIVAYYEKSAPISLPIARKPDHAIVDWAGFVLKMPQPYEKNAFTTLTAIDPYSHKIFCSGNSRFYTTFNPLAELSVWDSSFIKQISYSMPSQVVSAAFPKDLARDQPTYACIGKLEPADVKTGRVVKTIPTGRNVFKGDTTVASVLNRPVNVISGDFNNDHLTDVVVCEQGNLEGGVNVYIQNPDKSYFQIPVSDRPGAVQAIAGDFNSDGWSDLMILYGAADEGLWMYTNNKKGGFIAKAIMHFPPVYGSTSFQLIDLDHDGKQDLIYTCGYNFRSSRILKPYHGLYLFKNFGNWNFKQKWFYPINGCTKAIAADFHRTGDFSIATSAFFADLLNNPSEGCLYFDYIRPFLYKPHALPVSSYGRWLTMDVGDYNSDGKPDIVLGNYSSGFFFQPGLKPAWRKDLPFIVLENHM